jgi:3-hydroxyisobutyrate dehydrogenase
MTRINTVALMARSLLRAGHDQLTRDTNQSAQAAFENVRTTSSARDCAGADVILVANDAQILSVTIGQDGVVQAIFLDHQPIVCNMSTTLPVILRPLPASLEAAGARLLDLLSDTYETAH